MSCTVLLMPSSLQYIVYSSSLPWFQLPCFLFLLPLIKLLICFVHYSSHLCLVPLHAGPELSYKRLSCQLTFHPISRADPTEMRAQNQKTSNWLVPWVFVIDSRSRGVNKHQQMQWTPWLIIIFTTSILLKVEFHLGETKTIGQQEQSLLWMKVFNSHQE